MWYCMASCYKSFIPVFRVKRLSNLTLRVRVPSRLTRGKPWYKYYINWIFSQRMKTITHTSSSFSLFFLTSSSYSCCILILCSSKRLFSFSSSIFSFSLSICSCLFLSSIYQKYSWFIYFFLQFENFIK